MDEFLRIENRHSGLILRLRRVRDVDGQIVLEMEVSQPPESSGPPLHIHFHQREEFLVKSGTLGLRCGKETKSVPPGGTSVAPAGVVHTWWNAGDDLLEFCAKAIPAGDLDCYLQASFAVLNASPTGKPSIFYGADVMWRHRHSQALASLPRLIQWIIFPVILFVGRSLGKYRGANWPGSPASCTGAPDVDAANVKDGD